MYLRCSQSSDPILYHNVLVIHNHEYKYNTTIGKIIYTCHDQLKKMTKNTKNINYIKNIHIHTLFNAAKVKDSHKDNMLVQNFEVIIEISIWFLIAKTWFCDKERMETKTFFSINKSKHIYTYSVHSAHLEGGHHPSCHYHHSYLYWPQGPNTKNG